MATDSNVGYFEVRTSHGCQAGPGGREEGHIYGHLNGAQGRGCRYRDAAFVDVIRSE